MRREIPEPFIALLCFILGIWIWDNYFGETAGYAPGTEQIALIKIDRDLQLAEAMKRDPGLLRWLAHAQTLDQALDQGIQSLETLIAAQSLSPTGYHAYVTLLATREGAPPEYYLRQLTLPSSDPESPTWWNTKIKSANFTFEGTSTSITLRNRAVFVGSIIWLLAIVGLMFIPTTIRSLRKRPKPKRERYTRAWSPSLGLMVFLLATLAWIGFTMVVEIGITQIPGLPPSLAILLDTVARILPTLIALGLLFRKPSHIPRSLGLGARINPPAILGLFSLLLLIDQPLRWALVRFTAEDPTGGLSYSDSGLFGLCFILISACLVAPVSEEILYRGILYRSLANKSGVLAGALLSAVIFSVLHFYDYYGLASVATFGFFCALFYQSTGSLANVIFLHMIYNITITLPEWTIYHAPL
ncbi:lysostaphin resistance A-like protein [Luteolibacter sp. AS25]|uniref:CPBP family intramembrane glutamic endopeptidase n=1 Tax=Luteolibacter sp. AS25 TaxID=3135776 RepID=UPI00398B4646